VPKAGFWFSQFIRALLGLAVLACVLMGTATAKDLGVQGTLWPILEVDMRELLMKQIAAKDWGQIQAQMETSAKTYFDHFPKRDAPGVTHTQTRWYDPTFTLDNDIWAPVKNAQGDYEWQILYAKGKRVNPLSYQRPYNAMFFFDGHSKEQVAFVSAALQKYPGKLLPIEATGANPSPFAEQLHVPVFTVTAAMAQRFDISRTPSLLYPGDKEHRLELGFTTFAPPFQLAELQSSWPEGLTSSMGARP